MGENVQWSAVILVVSAVWHTTMLPRAPTPRTRDSAFTGFAGPLARVSYDTGFGYQQRWERGMAPCKGIPKRYPDDRVRLFVAGRSAHAELRAAMLARQQL